MINKIGKTRAKGEEYDVYFLTGNACSDAERKQTKAGKTFYKVNVAAQQNPDSTTMYVTVMGFAGLSATVGSFKKGEAVLAVGKLEKNDYNGKTYWNLIPEYVNSVGSGAMTNMSFKPVAQQANTGSFSEIAEADEELPF